MRRDAGFRRGTDLLATATRVLGAAFWKTFLGEVGLPSRLSFPRRVCGQKTGHSLGAASLVRARAYLDCCDGGSIYIGRHCQTPSYARLMTYGGDVRLMDQGVRYQEVRIHDDVWIGAGARALGGVEIGCGVVGAGALPARVLSIRGTQANKEPGFAAHS